MGLFFLVSGYFVPRSYDRRGATAFLKSRFIRLGIPALFVGWFVFGPIIYLTQDVKPSFVEFVRFLYQTGWQQPYVHLWFLLHLLLYNVGYAVWRLVMERMKGSETATSAPLSAGHDSALNSFSLSTIPHLYITKYHLSYIIPF